jgi:hypothetical protein
MVNSNKLFIAVYIAIQPSKKLMIFYPDLVREISRTIVVLITVKHYGLVVESRLKP